MQFWTCNHGDIYHLHLLCGSITLWRPFVLSCYHVECYFDVPSCVMTLGCCLIASHVWCWWLSAHLAKNKIPTFKHLFFGPEGHKIQTSKIADASIKNYFWGHDVHLLKLYKNLTLFQYIRYCSCNTHYYTIMPVDYHNYYIDTAAVQPPRCNHQG